MIVPISSAALRFAQASAVQQPFAAADTGAGGTSFGDTLKKALDEISTTQDNAQDVIQSFLRGDPVELHDVMAASEEAGLALEMLIEIRNKLTDAYRTLINMQS